MVLDENLNISISCFFDRLATVVVVVVVEESEAPGAYMRHQGFNHYNFSVLTKLSLLNNLVPQ